MADSKCWSQGPTPDSNDPDRICTRPGGHDGLHICDFPPGHPHIRNHGCECGYVWPRTDVSDGPVVRTEEARP